MGHQRGDRKHTEREAASTVSRAGIADAVAESAESRITNQNHESRITDDDDEDHVLKIHQTYIKNYFNIYQTYLQTNI